jgi:heme ABC exporter ATP-binding subunit CcmA
VVLTGIARRFGSRWILRGIDLALARGEVLALLGRNGSGKTTLLRILATLLRPTRGTATVFGHDIVRDADAVRAHVGFLAHANAIYPDLTAAENLGFTLRMAGRRGSARTIENALEKVGLANERGVRARDFSAGMLRRLSLARIGLLTPDLLLLDEPYSSLDPMATDLVGDLIAETRDRHGVVLMVTHDVGRARATAHRMLSLADGRIAAWQPDDATDEPTMADESPAAPSQPG